MLIKRSIHWKMLPKTFKAFKMFLWIIGAKGFEGHCLLVLTVTKLGFLGKWTFTTFFMSLVSYSHPTGLAFHPFYPCEMSPHRLDVESRKCHVQTLCFVISPRKPQGNKKFTYLRHFHVVLRQPWVLDKIDICQEQQCVDYVIVTIKTLS